MIGIRESLKVDKKFKVRKMIREERKKKRYQNDDISKLLDLVEKMNCCHKNVPTFCTQLCPHKQCYSLGIVRANEIRLAFDSGKGNCLNYSSNLISSNEKNITKYGQNKGLITTSIIIRNCQGYIQISTKRSYNINVVLKRD